jgi:16S rRNA (guanine527-N7)-methyltransferase
VTEDEAQAWLRDQHSVSRETFEKLDAFRALVVAESERQNLISAATVPHIWARHFVDSAQLLMHAAEGEGSWLDLGTGAGFPGMIIAILRDCPVIFVESRRKRVEFLSESVERLALTNVQIEGRRLELVETVPVSVITARAFAPLPRLFELAHRFSTEKTRWVLPKGRSAAEELETARASWQGTFHVKQSITDAEAAIIVASGVRRRKQART